MCMLCVDMYMHTTPALFTTNLKDKHTYLQNTDEKTETLVLFFILMQMQGNVW
jgi:hypothetical protein